MLFSVFNEKGLCILMPYCLIFLGFGPYVPDRGICHIIHIFECCLQITQNTSGKAKQQPLANVPMSITSEEREAGHLKDADPGIQLLICPVIPWRQMKTSTINKKTEHFTFFKISQLGKEE